MAEGGVCSYCRSWIWLTKSGRARRHSCWHAKGGSIKAGKYWHHCPGSGEPPRQPSRSPEDRQEEP